jgi:hypothetical protein
MTSKRLDASLKEVSMVGNDNKTSLDEVSEDKLYTTDHHLTARSQMLLRLARTFFNKNTGTVGVMFVGGSMKSHMFIQSGHEGGPWGGTQRGNVPRMPGWAFTQGKPHEGNIATHVEGHASAIMWERKIARAYLLVDRPMCNICKDSLYNTLPPGSELLVYSEKEGKTIVRAAHAA